jgi:hypothetical protein
MKRLTVFSALAVTGLLLSSVAFAAPGATPPFGNVDANFNTVTANSASSGVITLVGTFTGYTGGGSARVYNDGITWLNVLGTAFPAFIANGETSGGYMNIWNDGSIFTTGNLAIQGIIFNPLVKQPVTIQDPDGLKVINDLFVTGDANVTGDLEASNGDFTYNLDGTYISGYHLKVDRLGDDTWNKFWYKTIAPGTVADFSGVNSTCNDGDVAIACQYYAFKEPTDAGTGAKCASGSDGAINDDVIATKFVQNPHWDDPTPGGNCQVRLKNTRAAGTICGVVKTICLKLNAGP